MSKDPTKRPSLTTALCLGIFELHKNISFGFDPFSIENLSDVDANWPKLIDYLNELSRSEATGATAAAAASSRKSTTLKKSSGEKQQPPCLLMVNEKLIDVLLKPFMFFSARVREVIFPGIFIPREDSERRLVGNLDHLSYLRERYEKSGGVGGSGGGGKSEGARLEPFLDVDKYKAFVLPRILSLFSMRSTQIRIVLLQYFPFYVSYITDLDTLKYELLPEVWYPRCVSNNNLINMNKGVLFV